MMVKVYCTVLLNELPLFFCSFSKVHREVIPVVSIKKYALYAKPFLFFKKQKH